MYEARKVGDHLHVSAIHGRLTKDGYHGGSHVNGRVALKYALVDRGYLGKRESQEWLFAAVRLCKVEDV